MKSCSHPRTSVIIPAKNAGSTLAEALDSLLAQSDPDWQALIINDGSTDETADLIKVYAQRDRRFIGLHGTGAGASGARNIGIAQCNRTACALSGQRRLDRPSLSRPHERGVGCRARRCCGLLRLYLVMPDGQQQLVETDPLIAQAPFEMLAKHCAPAIHAVLIDDNILIRVGGFDTTLRTCEDWDLWQRVARLGGSWIPVDGLFSYYRASDDSLSRDVDQMLTDALIAIRRCFSPNAATIGCK